MIDRYEIAKLWSKLSHEGLTNDSLEVFTDKVVKGEESWKEILGIPKENTLIDVAMDSFLESAEPSLTADEMVGISNELIDVFKKHKVPTKDIYIMLAGLLESFKMMLKFRVKEGLTND